MRAAFLGCAHMHSYSYYDALKRLDIEIVGIYDPSKEQGEAFATAKGSKYYSDAEELLSEGIDFVIICSENAYHKQYTLQAAYKGIHVIVEKPIATNKSDAIEMIEACHKNSIKLFVCFPVRYAAPIIEAKKIVDSGQLGKIQSITGTNHGSMPGGWFIDKELAGGGAAIDHIVHVADIINWMLNSEVKEVYSQMDTLFHDISEEDCGHVIFELESGTICSIDHSWNRPKSFPVWGDVIMDINGSEKSLHIDVYQEQGDLYSDASTKSEKFSFGNDSDYEMLKDFTGAIQTNRPSPISGEDGLFALDLALAAYKSRDVKGVVRG